MVLILIFSPQKWKAELLHHQGCDMVTWDWPLGADSKEGIPSQTGCRKGCPHPWGAEFSQHRQRSPPLKRCSTCTSRSVCCGCVGRVCCARAGYEPRARSCTCRSTSVTCGTGRVSMAPLPPPSPRFSLSGAKMLQFSASCHLESCHIYFKIITLSYYRRLLPPKVLQTEGTNKVSNTHVCITSWLETLFRGSFQTDVCSIGFLSW